MSHGRISLVITLAIIIVAPTTYRLPADELKSSELSLADWSSIKTISLDAPDVWALSPSSPAETAMNFTNKPMTLTSSGADPLFEKSEVLGFDVLKGHAFLSRMNGVANDKTLWFERCDLVEGRSLGVRQFPQQTKLMDVDSNGQRLVTRPDEGYGKNDRLEIWDITGESPRGVAAWKPYDDPQFSRKDINSTTFVGADHLLTLSEQGDVVLWNIAARKAIYSLKTKDQPSVSPSRKYLALASDQGMFVLETMTGKPLGKLAGDSGSLMKFAFSQDGLRLAMFAAGGRLQVWDCEKGERTRDIYLINVTAAESLDWISDNYLLVNYVGKSHLVDVDRRIIFWRYEGIKDGELCGGRYWSIVGDHRGTTVLYPHEFPHQEALRSVSLGPSEEMLILKPRANVQLKVSTPAAPEHKSLVIETLTTRLQEDEITVSPDAPLAFEAVSEKGKTRPITFRGLGRTTGGNDTVQVTEQVYRMAINYNGQSLWQVSLVKSSPSLLRRKDGQSIEEALAEYTKPDVSFFITTPLPRMLARPGKHEGAYGVSRVTVQGIDASRP